MEESPMRLIRMLSVSCTLAAILVLLSSDTAPGKKPGDGQEIFRYDTFGDEQLWTDVLGMHEAIASVSPATALSVGLKVDVEALRPPVRRALEAGHLDVTDPAVTIDLLTMDAVVGVVAKLRAIR
jgi:hypothetical protein